MTHTHDTARSRYFRASSFDRMHAAVWKVATGEWVAAVGFGTGYRIPRHAIKPYRKINMYKADSHAEALEAALRYLAWDASTRARLARVLWPMKVGR